MNTAFLLIGGNMGQRLHNLQAATTAIAQNCGTIAAASAVYETAAWGLEEQPSFLNQALQLQTFLKPHALLDCLLQVETALGRVRDVKYGPRLIDIDILLYNHLVIDTPTLKIPHPQLPNRRFALQCLAEIAPAEMHPLFQKPMLELLQNCADTLPVHKFN